MSSLPRSLVSLCLGLATLGPALSSRAQPDAAQPMRGYTSARAQAQREIERAFQQLPSATRITEWHRYFTAEPHPATSPRTKAIAERIAQAWKEQGLEDVAIHRYDVLSSNPREVRVEMVSPLRYVPSLREDAYREDPDTANRTSAAPGYRSRPRATSPLRWSTPTAAIPPTTTCCARTASIRRARSSSSATRTRTAIAGSRR